MAVKTVGDLHNPTILFANGSIFNYKQFEAVYLPKLRNNLGDDFSYVLYDYIGYGYSSDLEGEFDFVTIAEQQVELMDSLGLDQAHLFGLSKGSIISQLVTATAPDRVLSLAGYGNPNLANNSGYKMITDDYSQRLASVRTLQQYYDERVKEDNFQLVYDTVYIPTIFDKSADQLNLIEKITNIWVRSKLKPMMMGTKISIMEKLFSYYLRQISDDEEQRYIEAIKSIDVPTLLIHGSADDTVPLSSSKLLEEWITPARLVVMDGYGHSRPTIIPWQGGKIMKEYAKFIRSLSE